MVIESRVLRGAVELWRATKGEGGAAWSFFFSELAKLILASGIALSTSATDSEASWSTGEDRDR